MIYIINKSGNIFTCNNSTSATKIEMEFDEFIDVNNVLNMFLNGDFSSVTLKNIDEDIDIGSWDNLTYDGMNVYTTNINNYIATFYQHELTETEVLQKEIDELRRTIEANSDYVEVAKIMIGET